MWIHELQKHATFLAIPIVLSLIYSISIQIFLAAWNECSWLSMINILIIQVMTIVAFCGFSSLILSKCTTDNILIMVVLLLIMLSIVMSIAFIRHARQVYIQGPKPIFGDGTVEGRVVLITGANTGIGKETAKQLLKLGATVIFACRSKVRAEEAMKEIQHEIHKEKNMDISKHMIFLPLDLSDMTSIHEAVNKFKAMNIPLHILINNAGIMMGNREESKQGFEMTMQCNHLGHFLLTLLLLPILKQKHQNTKENNKKDQKQHNKPRIITITSCTYTLAKRIQIDDLQCKDRSYSLFSQYAQSKLANILFSYELRKREPTITSVAIHPGLVRTNVTKNMSSILQFLNSCFAFILITLQKTPEAGAYTSVFCAATHDDDHVLQKGLYFINSKPAYLLPFAMNDDDSECLWNISEELVDYKYYKKE